MMKKRTKKDTARAATTAAMSRGASLDGEPVAEPPASDQPAVDFPIVGIGASAGGLTAFEAFFSGMPSEIDPGMAFVLVQHLAPDHKSMLTDLIRRYTRMQVFEVEDGMTVQINCAYIIPPGRDMAFLNGALHLLDPAAPRGQRLPIDFFFRSLAQDQRERAIGIVLSGTGSDGTLGVRAIKGEGGIVMAQTPASTEYDGMPRSAIATGLVDFELSPAEMAAQLIAYTTYAFGKPPRSATALPKAENALKKLFVLLRAQTGHDFSQYKPSTIRRRIERRMAVHQIESMESYVKFIQQSDEEVDALFRDMLIGVTNFFRDPEAFTAIEELVIPKLLAGKSADAAIRVWVPGCSTGEEAYSLAILLAECQAALKKSFKVQVFATDIDSRAIATARAGIYPPSIAAELTPERLARFFSPEPGGTDGNPPAYRIHKIIRDMLVFSEQNVIKDPPFSRMDLISCRNLLIYLDADLQKGLIPLFHYALNPAGVLFLGTSETVGEFGDLFAALDRKQKIYQRKEDLLGTHSPGRGWFLPPMTAPDAVPLRSGELPVPPRRLPLRELTEQALLQQVIQAGALVNAHGDILYLHGRTGMYLEPPAGEACVGNVLKMAREGLRRDLTTALHKAALTGETVLCPGLRVRTNGDFTTVNLIVRPVSATPAASPEPPLYLIILEQAMAGKSDQSGNPAPSDTPDTRITALQRELRAKEEYLQTANEELETSNEELKSSNEEMQSVNEELQSTNEELETSKEELQSVNEELATVNSELQTKVADLLRANNDMNNLMAGTGIATIFVDHQLRIQRFTPAATKIINLISGDIGRSVGHIVSNLTAYDSIIQDIQAVLDTLVPKEADMQTADGRWYTMRIQPYRTMDNVIEGVVLTFVDVTAARELQERLRKSEEILQAGQRLSKVGGWEWTVATQAMYWTEETYRIHDFAPGELDPGSAEHINRSVECYDAKDRPAILEAFQRCLDEGKPYDLEFPLTTAKGRRLWIRTAACPVFEGGKVVRVLGSLMDITERKLAEEARVTLERKYRTLYELSPDAHVVGEIAADGRDLGFVDCNQAALDLLGMTRTQLLAANAVSLSPERQPDGRLSREKAGELIAQCLSKGSLRFDWVHCRAGGESFPVEITMSVYREQGKTFLHSVWRDRTRPTSQASLIGQAITQGQETS
jgi:two-component system CheB/CheR fusion protein